MIAQHVHSQQLSNLHSPALLLMYTLDTGTVSYMSEDH